MLIIHVSLTNVVQPFYNNFTKNDALIPPQMTLILGNWDQINALLRQDAVFLTQFTAPRGISGVILWNSSIISGPRTPKLQDFEVLLSLIYGSLAPELSPIW